jgi:L-ribulokinase
MLTFARLRRVAGWQEFNMPYSIGFDFGTESVRVVLVDVRTGRVAAQATDAYAHGVIDRALPAAGAKLSPDFALQHPQDWLDSASHACRAALRESRAMCEQIVGVGVAFTSCTMLPTLGDGTPLCLLDRFKTEPLAWPKLWKHHGAKAETDRINQVARQRREPWLARYGGTIGIEWFFPKILETLNHAPHVYDAAEVWIEAGDWLVWQLTSGPFPRCARDAITRSTCQAGYKAQWNSKTGYPSDDYFKSVHPKLAHVIGEKVPGTHRSPGRQAGVLTARSAELLALHPSTPVSTAIIDAHAGVPGAGVASPSTMVMVLGTSSCHMMNSRIEAMVPGVAGVVEDGILPGYFGYETGQASVGDAFAWVARTLNLSHDELSRRAALLDPGSGGLMAIDWLNGCRTPLMDGRLSGGFVGLTLGTKPEQLYRAMLEATAFGLRWICDTLRDAGVPVRRFVASGGLPKKSPLLMQIYADVLDARIKPAASDESVALGAAILGALAAGESATGHASISQAIHAMAPQRNEPIYRPDLRARKQYDKLYEIYRGLCRGDGAVCGAMRSLCALRDVPCALREPADADASRS